MDEAQVTYRIGWVSAGLLLGFAVLADFLQVLFTITLVLAPASDIVTVVAEGAVLFYFFMRGVSFLRGKGALGRSVWLFSTFIIEMVPILDALPTLTLDTLYNVYSSRKEDRQAFDAQQAERAAQIQAQAAEEDAQLQALYIQRMRQAANESAEAANDDEEYAQEAA